MIQGYLGIRETMMICCNLYMLLNVVGRMMQDRRVMVMMAGARYAHTQSDENGRTAVGGL